MQESTAFEPSIPGAARQYWWLVVTGALGGAILGLVLALFVFNDSKAVTTILIEDPSSTKVFDNQSPASPERYLTSQVAILESSDLARAASDLEPNGGLTVRQILDSRTVISDPDSDLIALEFVHPNGSTAINYANAYSAAYAGYRTQATQSAYESAIAGIDSSIASVDEDLIAVEAEIEAVTTVPQEDELVIAIESAIRASLASPGSQTTPESVENLLNQLQSLEVIRVLQSQNPNLNLLYEARQDTLDRRTQLIITRDQLNADAAQSSSGVVAISEATDAQAASAPSRVVVLVMALGAGAGVALAYAKAMRSRRFDRHDDPEVILGAPMLAVIPEFDRSDPIPVQNRPSSPEAEAFRFAANALVARLGQANEESVRASVKGTRSVLVSSAIHGAGKTLVTLNMGISLASEEKTVLLVDADFDNPNLTRLIVGDGLETITGAASPPNPPGMTNFAEFGAGWMPSDLVFSTDIAGGERVDLLPRGTANVSPNEFFNSSATHEMLTSLFEKYDYVLIDTPPLLQASYAVALSDVTNSVVVVTPHNTLVSTELEARKRLDVVGARVIGYIYNRAVKRGDSPERRASQGQSRDKVRV